MSIVTLTMNPSLDVEVSVDRVEPNHKLRCSAPSYHPGGGGVNVARAAVRLGAAALAVHTSGGGTGSMVADLLDRERVPHRPVPIAGVTKTSFACREDSSGDQFRFTMPGPHLHEHEWQAALDAVEDAQPAWIVASGSVPAGVPDDVFARLCRTPGARLIVDTVGTPLRRAAAAGAYLLKPNLRELGYLTGEPVADTEQGIEAARRLTLTGVASAIALSLGADGGCLVTADGVWRYPSPDVEVRSRIGAGDSMTAGIVVALSRGAPLPDAVRFGVAVGAATVMSQGTQLCRREDAERLHAQMCEREAGVMENKEI